ncbi:MAG: PP2C family protein-serine/threonine phosphatase [Actinomycetota bacterium]
MARAKPLFTSDADAPPAESAARTASNGPWRALVVGGWLLLAALSLTITAVSLSELLGRPSLHILFRAGILAVDPVIASAFKIVGISDSLILNTDLAFRILGIVIFSLTALVIFFRKMDDWMTALASAMLLLTSTAWFAPLNAISNDSTWKGVADLFGSGRPFTAGSGHSIADVSLLLFLFLFPDGRFVPQWTRYLAGILAAHTILWIALPDTFVDPRTWPESARTAQTLGFIACGVSVQLYRYFAVSRVIQRQQTKIVVAALVTSAAVPVFLFVLNPGLGAGFEDLTVVTPRVEAVYNAILLAILGGALLLLPVSIAVSVLRYRLWDIDFFINRTIVYGALTGTLGLLYFAIVAGVGAVMTGGSYLTLVAATIFVALAFQPLRRRIQDLIDRQFYRTRYDAAHKLQEFAARLRQEIDLDTLAQELLSVIRETMRPTGVSLWTRKDIEGVDADSPTKLQRIAFGVEGGMERVGGGDFDQIDLDPPTVALLRESAGPVDLTTESDRSEALRSFERVRVRIAVPLLSQGELVGMINLGPRLSEADYSSQDLKLLDGLTDHAAASVRVALLVLERDAEMQARQRIESEIHVAQLIQQQFLPKTLPEMRGWDVHAYYRPAREVGGDFYDFIPTEGGRLVITAGDVTGKGVPAALVMATTRSILRGEARRLSDPAAILQSANELLVPDIPTNMFVTCLCAVFDPATGEMTLANAGHNLPYVRPAQENAADELKVTGMPLGLLQESTYEHRSTVIQPGETLVLHSDGITEAHNEHGEMFGFPRVKDMVACCENPGELIDRLLESVAEFVGPDLEQEDDVTLVVLHRQVGSVDVPEADPDELERLSVAPRPA